MNQLRLLVFDLDGTLVDTSQDLAMSLDVVRKELALDPLPLDLVSSYVGHGVASLVTRGLGAHATSENIEKRLAFFLDHYRIHLLDNTALYPGVGEAIENLGNHELAVLTNKPVNLSREIVTRLGIAAHFSYIYGGDSFPQRKPDPVGLYKMTNDLRISPGETMMIGDSDIDVLTGSNAGVWTCGVTYGFGAHSLENVSPDLMIGDMRELPRLLNAQRKV